jgi:hypothetical protein
VKISGTSRLIPKWNIAVRLEGDMVVIEGGEWCVLLGRFER